jgi:DNA-binding MarR family transcriptional regulator
LKPVPTSRAGSRPAGDAQVEHVESVLNSLRRTIRAFRAAAMTAESVLGISGAQHFALEKLAGAPPLSLNELASRTFTHKSSASVVVSRLVRRGYVRRERSRADRRGIVLTLTPAGRHALERAPDSAQSRLMRALRRLPDAELAGFARLFERLTAELGIRGLEPSLIFEDKAPGHGRTRRRPGAAQPTTTRSSR